jgi:tRNA pseudouridine38-40 synthase
MRNIKLTIEYDGTRYIGWQIQQKRPKEIGKENTIQGIIEKALEKILHENIRISGAGRTDAGVHAKGQVANFHTSSKIATNSLQKAINALLPQDIVITKAQQASPNFDARFSAKTKIYHYQILNRRFDSVFERLYCFRVPYTLNVNLMRKEARVLKGRHDFKSFQASDKIEKNSIRTIRSISVKKYGPLIKIDVEADGFLYNMVRNIVGTLIDIGRGRLIPGSMAKILKAKDRRQAGPAAPARGLCLLKVKY